MQSGCKTHGVKKISDVISYGTQHAFQSEKVIKLFKVVYRLGSWYNWSLS